MFKGVLLMTRNDARVSLYMPTKLKNELKVMSEETGLQPNQLTVMAINALLRSYEKKGSFIFVDLINPE